MTDHTKENAGDDESELPDWDMSGYVPPDPDEPPPVELWRAVGNVRPWGTLLLLLGWAAAFAWMLTHGELGDSAHAIARGASVTQRDPWDIAWRLLASTFLHSGPGHLLFNAASMLIYGPAVERVFNRWGFPIAYAVGGAVASLGSLLWRLSVHAPGASLSIGASGAIFALAGVLLAGAFRLRGRLALGRARALGAAVLFLILPALAGGFERLGTDNVAHVSGLAAGLLLGLVLPLSPALGARRAPAPVRVLGVAAWLALGAALVRVLRG